MDLPPTADDARYGEKDKIKTNEDPPEAKPSALLFEQELKGRERQIQWQESESASGKDVYGIYDAKKLGRALDNDWIEVVRDRREAAREQKAASSHILENQKPAVAHSVEGLSLIHI